LQSDQLSFETLWHEFPSKPDFSNHERDPEVAVLMYQANNNNSRFRSLDTLRSENKEQVALAKQDIIEEIRREAVSDKDAHDIMETFNEAMGRPLMVVRVDESGTCHGSKAAEIKTCACCGVRDMCRDDCVYQEASIDELDILELEDDMKDLYLELKNEAPLHLPCDDNGNFKDFHLHLALNVFESYRNKRYYALHPEFVSKRDGDEFVTLCAKCHKSVVKSKNKGGGVVPKYALKNVNFGSTHRIGLSELTLLERTMLSPVRHHYKIVKIQGNAKR
jgi:hypothetical protein